MHLSTERGIRFTIKPWLSDYQICSCSWYLVLYDICEDPPGLDKHTTDVEPIWTCLNEKHRERYLHAVSG